MKMYSSFFLLSLTGSLVRKASATGSLLVDRNDGIEAATPREISPPLRHVPIALTASAWRRLSPRMRTLVEMQPAFDMDNNRYTPQLSVPFEEVPGLGQILIGQQISASSVASIFAIRDHPRFLIKYRTNCDKKDSRLHPLLIEYWLGVEAARIGVAAMPIFVSPAARMVLNQKVPNYLYQDRTDCVAAGGVVRFMVMERAGDCLNKVSHRGMRRAATVGVELMTALRALHAIGIFHGDVHGGNICQARGHSDKFVLIDFELGGFTDGESDDPIRPPLSWVHASLTPWQLDGRPFARRDDVFKTMEVVAETLFGREFWATPKALVVAEPESLLRWKRTADYFQPLPFTNVPQSGALSERQANALYDQFRRALAFARTLVSVETTIPYEPIIDQFAAVLAKLRAAASTTPPPAIDGGDDDDESEPLSVSGWLCTAFRWLTRTSGARLDGGDPV